MGLSIRWYRGLKARPDAELDDEGLPIYDTLTVFRLNEDFPGRECQISPGIAYEAETWGSFDAGSYGGYNEWRNELAELAGYPLTRWDSDDSLSHAAGAWQATAGHFWELIYFSDCEGVIGAEIASKLAENFQRFQSAAERHPEAWFIDLYKQFQRAFKEAAHNGAVSFH